MASTCCAKNSLYLARLVFIAVCWLLPACSSSPGEIYHGYIEGEFVYIASPLPGTVTLAVKKGTTVKKGDPLFALESDAERSSRDEARRRLAQAEAGLRDLGKGLRPTELAALNAQKQQARSTLTLAEIEYGRQEKLFRSGVVSAQSLDNARTARDEQLQSVAKIEADLKTASLGARSDQVAGAQSNVLALEAVVARTEWELAQKSRKAPEDALVYDTLYRSGEWVAAGKPVVALLPPAGVKVRFYIPETKVASIQPGNPVTITVDGLKDRFAATVSYISPGAEYTPPVIYSRESRAKLVYLVEAVFPPEKSSGLHPGQPVDIRLGPINHGR